MATAPGAEIEGREAFAHVPIIFAGVAIDKGVHLTSCSMGGCHTGILKEDAAALIEFGLFRRASRTLPASGRRGLHGRGGGGRRGGRFVLG